MRELKQRWDNRLTFENLSVCEDYRDGRIAVLLYFDLLGSGPHKPSDLVVADDNVGEMHEVFVAVLHYNVLNAGNEQDRDNEVMLIPNVQLVEFPGGKLPSLVGLYRVDNEVPEIGVGSMYLSLRSQCRKFLPCLAERDLRALRAASIGDDLVYKQFDGNPEIVDSIPENQRDSLRERMGLKVDKYMSGFRVFLDSKGVRISIKEGSEGRFKLLDVAVGPFDL